MLKVSPICYEVPVLIPFERPFAILLVRSGNGFINVKNKKESVAPGRVFLLKSGQQTYLNGGMVSGHVLEFKNGLMDYYLARNVGQRNRGLFNFKSPLPYTDLSLEECFSINKLVGELSYECENGTVLAQDYLFLLLKLCNRKAEEQAMRMTESQIIANKLEELIDNNCKTERSPLFYAKQLGITPKKLNKISRENFTKKFFDVLTNRLVREADLMLINTKMSMKEISAELGFYDSSNFATYYKRVKGIMPTQFRNIGKGNLE